VAWLPLSTRTLFNPQSLPNRAEPSNSKVATIVFLKRRKNGGVEHDKVPETPFASRSSAVTELFDFDNDNMMKHHLQLAA
jgi:hypothetical protein